MKEKDAMLLVFCGAGAKSLNFACMLFKKGTLSPLLLYDTCWELDPLATPVCLVPAGCAVVCCSGLLLLLLGAFLALASAVERLLSPRGCAGSSLLWPLTSCWRESPSPLKASAMVAQLWLSTQGSEGSSPPVPAWVLLSHRFWGGSSSNPSNHATCHCPPSSEACSNITANSAAWSCTAARFSLRRVVEDMRQSPHHQA